MIRRLFTAACVLSAATLMTMVGQSFGPAVESRFFPVRTDQTIEVVERTEHRLCWRWTFTKLRDIASPDLDAFLQINGEQGGVTSIFSMTDGRPWGLVKFAVPPRAEPYTLFYCTALAPYVAATDTVRVRQTAFYPGFLGLWRLEVPFPDVVDQPP